MKTVNLQKQKVKPLVGAVVLSTCAVASANAQPIVSIGGSFNASALASVSSSFPAFNTSQALNVGYSGGADISLPSSGNSVQSVIAEMGSGASSSETLPGLSDVPASAPGPGGNEMAGLIQASLVTETATQALGSINSTGMQSPSSDVPETSATESAPSGNGTSGHSLVTDTTAQTVASISGSGMSVPSPDVPAAPTPGGDGMSGLVQASLVTDTTADVAGHITGTVNSAPALDVFVNAATSATADLVANVNSRKDATLIPEVQQPDAENDGSSAAEEVTDQVADGSEAPQQPAPGSGAGNLDLAAAVENRNQADAFVTLY